MGKKTNRPVKEKFTLVSRGNFFFSQNQKKRQPGEGDEKKNKWLVMSNFERKLLTVTHLLQW